MTDEPVTGTGSKSTVSSYTPEPIEKEKEPILGRVTVTGGVYYQLNDRDAVRYGRNFQRFVRTEEDPYTRRIKVDENWQLLNFEWNKERLGLFIIENIGQPRPTHNPDPSTIPSKESLEVHLRYVGDKHHWVIPLKEWDKFTPEKCTCHKIEIRCLGGPSYIILHAFPR